MFRLAHLSDFHIAPLPRSMLVELAGKRITGYLNWRLRRVSDHRVTVLEQLIDDVLAARVDHAAVTGDLVNIAAAAEFDPARRLLERVGAPDRVSVTPGNHDVYTRAAIRLVHAAFGPFMIGDDAPAPASLADAFPFVRTRGGVALIGLNSGVPTPPFHATGTLGQAQLVALENALGTCQRAGLARVVLIHHPPFAIEPKKSLTDHLALAEVLKARGAELVLHGHTHKGTIRSLPGPAGDIPVVGAPAASQIAGREREPAAWNLLTIRGGPDAWSITLNRRAADGATGRYRDVLTRQLSPAASS